MIIFGKNKISRFVSEKKRLEFTKAYQQAFALYPQPTRVYDIKTSFGMVKVYEYLPEKINGTTAMVFFHGHYASSLMWEPNLVSFMETTPIYLLDFIDEPGLSRQRKALKNHKDQAFYLEEVFKKLKLLKFHLVGVSLGGWKAVNYAYYYPRRVASLILLDPVSVFSPLSKEIVFKYLKSLGKEDNMVEYLLNGQSLPEGNPFSKTITMAMNDYYFGTAFPLGTRKKALKALTCPVLAIMAGKSPLHDGYKSIHNGRKWVTSIEIENWEDASHALSYEFAEQINRKIKSFIKRWDDQEK